MICKRCLNYVGSYYLSLSSYNADNFFEMHPYYFKVGNSIYGITAHYNIKHSIFQKQFQLANTQLDSSSNCHWGPSVSDYVRSLCTCTPNRLHCFTIMEHALALHFWKYCIFCWENVTASLPTEIILPSRARSNPTYPQRSPQTLWTGILHTHRKRNVAKNVKRYKGRMINLKSCLLNKLNANKSIFKSLTLWEPFKISILGRSIFQTS